MTSGTQHQLTHNLTTSSLTHTQSQSPQSPQSQPHNQPTPEHPTKPPNMADQPTLKLLAHYSITTFLLSTGALALLSPTTMASLFGMPIPDSSFAAGFVQCMGGRNLTFGIISAIFVQRRDLRAAATMAALLAVDGCIDGWVTWTYAGFGAAIPHFAAAAVVPFVSAWMGS